MSLILNNLLWPLIIVAGTIVASLISGSTNAKAIGPAWPMHALKNYAAPALVVALLGCMYTLGSYSLSAEGFYHCHDQSCRFAAMAAADRTTYLKFGLTLLASFATIALMMWLPVATKAGLAVVPWRDRSVSFRAPSGSEYVNPDPEKWYFDKDSGEFFPITFWDGDEFLFDRATHRQRYGKELNARRQFRSEKITLVVLWLITIFGLCFSSSSGEWRFVLIGLASMSGFIAVIASLGVAFKSTVTMPRLKREIGPEPVPPPGREMVAKQNLHGNAVPLSGERLKRAAAGKVNIPPRRDTDRPARDYSV